MEDFQAFDHELLDSAGLNRQAVFDIDTLPADIAAPSLPATLPASPCASLS